MDVRASRRRLRHYAVPRLGGESHRIRRPRYHDRRGVLSAPDLDPDRRQRVSLRQRRTPRGRLVGLRRRVGLPAKTELLIFGLIRTCARLEDHAAHPAALTLPFEIRWLRAVIDTRVRYAPERRARTRPAYAVTSARRREYPSDSRRVRFP